MESVKFKSPYSLKRREIEHFFHISTGYSLEEFINFLPRTPRSWPRFSKEKREDSSSPSISKLKALEKVGLSALKVENSIAWSDVEVGHVIKLENEGTTKNTSIGVNIRFPFPLFHRNGGARAQARSQMTRAKNYTRLAIEEENHERLEQLRIYESALRVLKHSMKEGEIERKYRKIKKHYQRGIVSEATFLESQKQRSNFLKGLHQREIVALEALWSIYQFDGKVFEVKI